MRGCVAILVFALIAQASGRLSAPAGHAQHFHARALDNRRDSSPTTTFPTPTGSTLVLSSSSPSTNQSSSSTLTESTTPTTLTSSSAAPSQTSNSSALTDINAIHTRRLPFIVAGVSSPSKLSSWSVVFLQPLCLPITLPFSFVAGYLLLVQTDNGPRPRSTIPLGVMLSARIGPQRATGHV